MDLATSEELVSAVQDWSRVRYYETEIESRRTTVWRYLMGEHEPYTASTALSHRITIPFYRFLHILFNGTISVRIDNNRDLVITTEIDLLWAIDTRKFVPLLARVPHSNGLQVVIIVRGTSLTRIYFEP
ncbi:hypothetical protein LINGRAHAP2_LOCUS7416 [Linum grandiflorum]